MTEPDLALVCEWARAKVATGAEPPWAWYQYMKLIETLETIMASTACVTTERSRQSDLHPDAHLQLVVATGQKDSALPHHAGLPVQTPM